MIPRVPLREALSDPNLLGAAIAGDSWRSWRALLIAAMGEELREEMRSPKIGGIQQIRQRAAFVSDAIMQPINTGRAIRAGR